VEECGLVVPNEAVAIAEIDPELVETFTLQLDEFLPLEIVYTFHCYV